jgi:Streptomyces sporulation and cell division protein, SsgA
MNSSDHDMVRAAQELRLIGPEQMIVPLTAEWCYSRQDPYAVTMSLNTGADEPVKWTFCRELLAAALLAPAGIGDVQAWPAAESAASAEDGAGTSEKIINIVLDSPDGCARFEAGAAGIEEFLARTYEVVPAGQESGYLNIDAGLTELLTQA